MRFLDSGFLLSSSSRLPKYAQFREAVIGAIDRGEWKPGDRLPAEQEFTRALPFSLGTIQKGLRILADEGVLVRTHGSGTFVAENRKQMEALQHVVFLRADERGFLPVYSDVVNRRRVMGNGPWSALLQQGGSNVFCLERRLDVDGKFSVFSRFFVNVDRFRSFIMLPLDKLNDINFKQVLQAESSLPITHITESIRVIQLPADVTRVLSIPSKSVGMGIEAVAYGGKDNALYYQELFVPPTTYKLAIDKRL